MIVVFAMADFREERAAVKFCFLLGKTGTETLEMLKTAYKNDAMVITQVFGRFSRLKLPGRESHGDAGSNPVGGLIFSRVF